MKMVDLLERQEDAGDPQAEATREIIAVLAAEQDGILQRSYNRGWEDYQAGRFVRGILPAHLASYYRRRGFTEVDADFSDLSEDEKEHYRSPFRFYGPDGLGRS